MNLNDELTLTPTFPGTGIGLEDRGEVQGRVVYIHPEQRFYTVEFQSAVTGETWRETFYFQDRSAPKYSDTSAPRLPAANQNRRKRT